MDHSIALDVLAQSLSRAFPDLGTFSPLKLLGEGFSSTVLETPEGIVFRVARHAQAGARYAREARLLPLIKPYLPIAIPEPRWQLAASADFPFGVIGYRKLPGRTMNPEQMSEAALRMAARQIGALCVSLQRIPPDLLALEQSPAARLVAWRRMRAVSSPALQAALPPEEFRKVEQWWKEFLGDERMRSYLPVFQHGDLWFGNLLVEGDRITGLLDFEEAGPGDPAQDFVPQLYLGQRFLEWTLEAFQEAGGAVDDNFHHRLRHLWAVREFGGLVYAVEQDPSEFSDAVEKIRRGPILNPFGLDGWSRL